MVEQAMAVLLTFGSYRLDVHGRGSDIDALVFGPSYIDRDHYFFDVLGGVLAETEAVTELQPVPRALMPVIKMRFRGVPVDNWNRSCRCKGVRSEERRVGKECLL